MGCRVGPAGGAGCQGPGFAVMRGTVGKRKCSVTQQLPPLGTHQGHGGCQSPAEPPSILTSRVEVVSLAKCICHVWQERKGWEEDVRQAWPGWNRYQVESHCSTQYS